jgi:ABC-2 type transport system permease protein
VSPGEQLTVAPLSRMLLAQTGSQLRILVRTPAFSVTSLLLPIVLFTFFGLPFAHLTRHDAVSAGVYLLASFGAYAVGSVMVYAFGVGVALERGTRVDALVRASPLPPAVYMLAKVITAMIFACGALVLLFTYGALMGGVHQPLAVWITVIVRLLAGAVPFIALGLAIGYLAGPGAAPAVANFIYLPLAFASGIFLPLDRLPSAVQSVAPYLPMHHYARLAWSAVGSATEPLAVSVAWLAGYTVVFFVVAVLAFRREERARFA